MKQQITLGQYRTIDLIILAVVLAISQALIHFAAVIWFPGQRFIISPVAVLTALVMMRWGIWGGLHALLGGLIYTMLAGGTTDHYIIYCVGNLASLLALLMFKFPGKEKIRKSNVWTQVFALCVQVLMLLGRAAVAAVLGFEFAAWLGFITTDSLSILFTLVVAWIIRRIDGLFEDQIHYLLRIQSEQSTEGGEQL